MRRNMTHELSDEAIRLTTELVRIPSRGGIDPIDPSVEFVEARLDEWQVPSERLYASDGRLMGLFSHVEGASPGPTVCLAACLDTAAWGDEDAWSFAPTSASIEDGRLYGRGAADSKAACAVFMLLLRELRDGSAMDRGNLLVVFDGNEHTGEFQGIKSFLEVTPYKPDAVVLGYPGNDTLKIGSRGFLRADVTVFGVAAHSGSKSNRGVNAIDRMADLLRRIQEVGLPMETDPDFAFGPKVTVTEISGGHGYSTVPDRCDVKIDIRLTPNVDEGVARQWIEDQVAWLDAEGASARSTNVAWQESWPAYSVPRNSPLVTVFEATAQRVFGKVIVPVIVGPSNIGNYLARIGIPTLNGFGVSYDNAHAADEWIDLQSIGPVFDTYYAAVPALLAEPQLAKTQVLTGSGGAADGSTVG